VPCASNTGPALSVLAPGVGWTTTVEGGGQTSGFSGTSAAAPVTAAALLLARQARPLGDPGVAIDLLRATGAPVRDARTGLTAPRVDLAAALDASTPVAGNCASVSTLSLALAIDHPDRTQLVVTLAGPDGTEVKVLDHEGRAGDAVREVFGLTAASAEALSAFAGKPLEGIWRLSVADTVPGGAGHVVSWALFVEPSIPEPEPAFPAATSFVATTVHRIGKLGAFYTTDLRLFNADSAAAHDILLRFAPAGPGVPRTLAVTLAPLTTRVLDDVVHDAFRMEGYGPIFLSADPAVVAATRTSTTAPRGGSFGLSLPAETAASAVGAGSTLVLVPSFKASGFRVNVGVTEVTGRSVNVEVALRDPSGALRALIPRSVPAGGLVQLNDVYSFTNLTPGPADRIEVRVTDGAGRVAAWATPVDDSTNDGSFVAAHPAASRVLIPAVVRSTAAPGMPSVTDLKLSNAGAAPTRVLIALFPLSGSAVPPATATVTLAGNETRAFDDVLGTLLAAGDASGALRITSLDGAVYASARTSTTDGVRSYGFAVDPSAASAQAGPGQQLALTFLSSSPSHLTNVGLVEAGGFSTLLRVTLLAPDGTIAATRDLSLDPFGAVRWDDVFAAMQAAPLADASLVVDVLSGGSAVAYAIVVDTRTGDASYFASSLVP
jgi:subtilisin-like proprotein convertase family protein